MSDDTGDGNNTGENRSGGNGSSQDDPSLNDLLQELRILLQGVQVLTAFLVILPFNQGFEKIDEAEKWVYLATFLCSVTGLILFSAPAAQHRIIRPLTDREEFKNYATRMTLVGLVFTSFALILATQLVVAQVFGLLQSLIAAGIVALLLALLWWILPFVHKRRQQR